MKKTLTAVVFVFSLLLLLVSFGEGEQENLFEITGVPKNRLVCSEVYYDIFAELNGTRVKCEWQVSNADTARISSAKKLYIRYIKEPSSFVLTAVHPETGCKAEVMLTAVPAAGSVTLLDADGVRIADTVFVDIAEGPVTFRLTGDVQPRTARHILIWNSEDETVADVDSEGLVTVKKLGECIVTAETVNGKKDKVVIKAFHSPETILLRAPSELAVSKTAFIEWTIGPEEAADARLSFISSDPKTLSVNSKGEIKALRGGNAVITVSADNGVQAQSEVECYYPVTSVGIPNGQTVNVGETKKLIATVKPDNAKYKELTFISESPEIAVVDAQGNVTGIAAGKARIVVAASNGITAARDITVKYVPLKAIKQKDYYKSMLPGEAFEFTVTLTPPNASDRKIVFESSNPDVAYADENGVVHAVAPGRARIFARSENASFAPLSLNVRVKSSEGALPLEGVIIGLNPGHQITRNFTQLPVAPGSKSTKNANSGYAIGVRTGNTEYQINLDVALLLRDELEALGAAVVMTRTENDVKINNIERAEMLNEAGCDAALQIHCDKSSDKAKNGFYTYVKIKDAESSDIACKIKEGVNKAAGARINPTRYSNQYMSLNWSATPSVLLELGYLSNPDEDVLLGTHEYQLALAKGIAEGLACYFN